MSRIEMQPLGAIAERVTVGHVGSTSKYYRDEGVIFLRTQNVGSGSLDLTDVKFVTPEFNARLKKSQVQPGDVLLSRVITNTVRVAVVPEGFAEANCANIVLVRPGPSIDARYLAYFIASPVAQRQLLRGRVGSAQTVVNTTVVKKWRLPLPPLAEQKRIAGILDAADALRAKRRESLAQLDTLLQSTFLDMFGDPVTNPMGWEVSTLGAICLEKPAYGSGAPSCRYDRSRPRYVRITDIDETGELSDKPRSAELSETDTEKYRLHAGDVLFARSGATVGKSFLYRREHGPCVYAGYLIRFRPDPRRLLPEVLFRYTQTSAYWRWVSATARAVAQPNINAKMYSSLVVVLPPREAQLRFMSVVEAVVANQRKQRAHLAELDTLFASLQSRAFRGEL